MISQTLKTYTNKKLYLINKYHYMAIITLGFSKNLPFHILSFVLVEKLCLVDYMVVMVTWMSLWWNCSLLHGLQTTISCQSFGEHSWLGHTGFKTAVNEFWYSWWNTELMSTVRQHNWQEKWIINPSKKVLQFKFEGWYLSCYWSMKKETGIIEKLDYCSLQWCAICRDYVIMECAVLLNIGQSQKWNVAKCIVFHTEVYISFEDAMCFE